MRAYSKSSSRPIEEVRKDALQNRAMIIRKARQLFAKHGPEITLTQIVKESKISRSTFYRNFPDKHNLVLAIFMDNLEALDKYAVKICGSEDEFFNLLCATVKLQSEFHSLIPYLPKEDKALINKLNSIFEDAVQKAKQNKKIREDFDTETDLPLLITMLGSSLIYGFEGKKETQVQRAMDLVMDGIKG